jgi:hypothetical protein
LKLSWIKEEGGKVGVTWGERIKNRKLRKVRDTRKWELELVEVDRLFD